MARQNQSCPNQEADNPTDRAPSCRHGSAVVENYSEELYLDVQQHLSHHRFQVSAWNPDQRNSGVRGIPWQSCDRDAGDNDDRSVYHVSSEDNISDLATRENATIQDINEEKVAERIVLDVPSDQ